LDSSVSSYTHKKKETKPTSRKRTEFQEGLSKKSQIAVWLLECAKEQPQLVPTILPNVLEYISESSEAFALAEFLHKLGNTEAALEIAQKCIKLECNCSLGPLADLFCEIYASKDKHEEARQLAWGVMQKQPTLKNLQTLQKFSGETWWNANQKDIVDMLRKTSGYEKKPSRNFFASGVYHRC